MTSLRILGNKIHLEFHVELHAINDMLGLEMEFKLLGIVPAIGLVDRLCQRGVKHELLIVLGHVASSNQIVVPLDFHILWIRFVYEN